MDLHINQYAHGRPAGKLLLQEAGGANQKQPQR
jgi:hypothetical protein